MLKDTGHCQWGADLGTLCLDRLSTMRPPCYLTIMDLEHGYLKFRFSPPKHSKGDINAWKVRNGVSVVHSKYFLEFKRFSSFRGGKTEFQMSMARDNLVNTTGY